MSNLIDIQGQIEKLQKQASEIKKREFDKTIQEILAQMQAYDITVKDLQVHKGRRTKTKEKIRADGLVKRVKRVTSSSAKKNSRPVAAKYRGPNGETWSGRGLMPRWLSALVAQGKSKEIFAITS